MVTALIVLACVLPPPNPPSGATIEQVKEAQRWQIAYNYARAHGLRSRAYREFRAAYCYAR